MSTRDGIFWMQNARRNLVRGIYFGDIEERFYGYGIVAGLFFSKCIDGDDFSAFHNESRFLVVRTAERREQGLPV